MKTPREILFERHRLAGPRLDAVRRKVLTQLGGTSSTSSNSESRVEDKELVELIPAAVRGILRLVWLELIWPCRRTWAGLGTVWLVVLGANLEMRTTAPAVPLVRAEPATAVAQAFAERRRVLAELLPSVMPQHIQAAPPTSGRRSERPVASKAC